MELDAAPPPLPPGTRLRDELVVRRLIGRGGMGLVYAVWHEKLHLAYAVKEYLPAELAYRAADRAVRALPGRERRFEYLRDRFLDEGRMLARLAEERPHPNLIVVNDAFESNGTAYLRMRLEQAQPLGKILTARGLLDETQIRAWLWPLLDGLEHAHRHRIWHRDIKPSNILIREDGSPLLIDFGAARWERLDSQQHSVLHQYTPEFAAPEQLERGPQGPWTDLYGMAATWFYALTGRLPHRPGADVPVPAGCSPAFFHALLIGLEPDPARRPRSVAEWRRHFPLSSGAADCSVLTVLTPTALTPTARNRAEAQTRVIRRVAWFGGVAFAVWGAWYLFAPGARDAPGPAPADDAVPTAAATLVVRADAGGARWSLDGQPMGAIGGREQRVAAGTHWIKIEKDGAFPFVRQVELAPDTRHEVHAALVPIPELVALAGGCFAMGSPPDEPGRDADEPQRRVCVAAFSLGKYEVTVGEFRRFVAATGYVTDAERHADGQPGCFAHDRAADDPQRRWAMRDWANWHRPIKYRAARDDWPVTCVSWRDVQAYLAWLNGLGAGGYRLPTEAEWEYAARAGTATARFWGADPARACAYANVGDRSLPRYIHAEERHPCTDGMPFVAPVGRFAPNPWGLYDLLGNVWELTCSPYAPPDPAGNGCQDTTPSSARTLRGGSWIDKPRVVRAANRGLHEMNRRLDDVGFRLARD